MTGPTKRVEPAELEAAAWHARLGAPRVASETIEEFFAWRQKPSNAEAYRRVEQAWTTTGSLAADPEIAEALEAAMSRRTKARPVYRVKALVAVGASVAVATIAVAAWVWASSKDVYATAVGEQRSVQLADGSSVRLDTNSRIRVRFDSGRRTVELASGQALFNVAHDAHRPFVVEAGEAQVTAVGTVFDVRRVGEGVEVTLVAGVVDVLAAQGKTPARMGAGHQARVGSGGLRVAAVDTRIETSWADGRVVFRDTPLRDAVAEVNRYLADPIVLDAPSLETEAVNGVFKTGDRDAFVYAATAALGLRSSAGPNGSIRLTAEK